jgi:putative ABC transport system permease protein
MSTLNRKAWGDLTRHRTRTLLAVFTLCVATASLAFFAVPSLLNGAMERQVQQSHLYDVGVPTRILALTPAQLSALGHLPGITAVSPVLGYGTKAASAAGTQNIEIVGTALASAPVDTVPLLTGRMPGPGEALADAANGRAADYAIPNGGTLRVRAASGALVPLRISGTGMNLAATPGANGSTTPVFYTTQATMESLRGVHGFNFLGFRLKNDTRAAQYRAIAEVRAYLTAHTGSDPITGLPSTRGASEWPGQAAFGRTIALLYIITVLAFLSALFLISATMNTLIAEQAGEIAILKTLGGRRRQIGGIILRTAAMLGAAGAAAGTIIGIGIAYLLVHYFAETIIDVSVGFAIAVPVVVVSLLLGPVLAVAASLPALRRALRRPVADTLAGAGTAGGFGASRFDRLVARSGLLSETRVPGSVRMGVRNVLRQKRRSLATIAQVAVAAGLAITFLALGQSVSTLISQTVDQLRFSIGVGLTSGSRPFGSQAVAVAAATPGVTAAQPVETSSVQYNGQTYVAWGLGTHPLYAYRLSAGHWFTAADLAADGRAATAPVVLGPAVARAAQASVGKILTFDTPAGYTHVRVIGIDAGAANNGDTVYFPRPALERLDGGPGTADSIWLTTASSGHAAINRVAAAAASRLTAAGYRVSTQELYAVVADDTASEHAVLRIVQILGLLVVAIMLMGLVSALSMGVIERTREVGILRCVGARARNVRRVFSVEAVVLAAVGWVLAVPLGWLMFEGLRALILHNVDLSLPDEFGPVIPLATLVGVLVLTLIVIRGPLRRATRIQPGTALRYQ